ncbi:hypothetical protein ACFPM7_17170 [Actinokineospora guangxiensis]|uniref:DUF1097 domain-containing protein n=1 Tax=Actinokineospora guangxiensis TaxID=1490288 RepID=A0ABW0EPU5_9PSEU
MDSSRVVNRSESGAVWAVRDAGGAVLAEHRLKADAIEDAIRQLRPAGGELRVYTAAGVLQNTRAIAADAPLPRVARPVAETWSERTEREGGTWDTGLDVALPVLAGLGGAALSPEVAGADGWIGVFFATLAFSLGCALATWALAATKVSGWPALFTVVFAFVASVSFAAMVGAGVLEIASIQSAMPDMGGPPWLRFLMAVVVTAFTTFGLVGTVLGGAVGVWVGVRAARSHARPAA